MKTCKNICLAIMMTIIFSVVLAKPEEGWSIVIATILFCIAAACFVVFGSNEDNNA